MISAAAVVALMAAGQPGNGQGPVAPTPPAAAAAPTGAVQLRGQVSSLSGEVGGVSFAGVLLKATADDPGRLIGWDRVRSVDGAAAESAAAYRAYGDALMRVRARLERGDYWLADAAIEPLYQKAVESPAERFVGPSGLLLAECELRSGLERNASATATLAWLQWAAVDRTRPKVTSAASGNASAKSPQWVGGAAGLPAVVDAATGLCPRLPPLFPHQGPSSVGTLRVLTKSPHLRRLCADDSPARVLASCYSLAARIAAGEIAPGESASLPAPSGDAEQLVTDMVAAQTAPSEPMRAARARLQRRLELLTRDSETKEITEDADGSGGGPVDRSWQRAWLHAAIGRSLLSEDQRALRRQGMVELLYVPALDGNTQPGLAATALLDVLDELRRDAEAAGGGAGGGNEAAISAVSLELRTRFGVEAVSTPSPEPAQPIVPIAPAPQPSTSPGQPSKESP